MNPPRDKTIIAISTPPGYGGIGIIRLSGSESVALTKKLLRSNGEIKFIPNQAVLHYLRNPETGFPIDETIITFFQSPQSYTGEDVIEISCHGSPVVLSEIIRLLLSFGGELAQPGEFTLRAFLNHRLDLAQAEAINDLIQAQTTYQAQVAARQLRGSLSKQLQPIKKELVDLIVHFESSVEFVEDDLSAIDLKFFILQLDRFIDAITKLTSSYRIGRVIKSGIRLALVGRPNVGKSSIFNQLLNQDRAIITHIPGTTRDILVESFSLYGIPVFLIDTAGLHETEDFVEQIGMERTKIALSEADFIIAVFEANKSSSVDDLDYFGQFPVNLYVINKCDLGINLPDSFTHCLSQSRPIALISALTGQGMEELRQLIYHEITRGTQAGNQDVIITNERHFLVLQQALDALQRAKLDLVSGFTEEVALTNLHRALRNIGEITGETLIGDVINQIFSTFCIGK